MSKSINKKKYKSTLSIHKNVELDYLVRFAYNNDDFDTLSFFYNKYKSNFNVQFYYALYLKKINIKESLLLFNNLLFFYPNNNYIKLELVEIFIDLEKYDDALSILSRCINDDRYILLKSIINKKTKKFNEALNGFNSILASTKIKFNSDDKCLLEEVLSSDYRCEAYLNKGLLFEEIGEYEDALSCYMEGINSNRQFFSLRINHFNLLIKLQRYEEAFFYITEFINLYDKFCFFRKYYFVMKDIKINEIIQLRGWLQDKLGYDYSNENIDSNYLDALKLFHANRLDESLDKLKQVDDISNERVLFLMASIYYNKGNYSSACEFYSKLFGSKNFSSFAYNKAILACLKIGDVVGCIKLIDEANSNYITVSSEIYYYLFAHEHIIFKNYIYPNETIPTDIRLSDSYSENRFINRTISNYKNSNDVSFRSSIDISRLYKLSKNYILSEYRIPSEDLYDHYVFKFNDVGTNDMDYVEIVTYPGTKEIIELIPRYKPFGYSKKLFRSNLKNK